MEPTSPPATKFLLLDDPTSVYTKVAEAISAEPVRGANRLGTGYVDGAELKKRIANVSRLILSRANRRLKHTNSATSMLSVDWTLSNGATNCCDSSPNSTCANWL